MVFVVEGGGPKIDKADLGVEKDPSMSGISLVGGRGGRYLLVVGERLICIMYQ